MVSYQSLNLNSQICCYGKLCAKGLRGNTKIDVKFEMGELDEVSVVRKFRTTGADGKIIIFI